MVSGEHYNKERYMGRGCAPTVDREGRRAALCGGSAQHPSLRSRATQTVEIAKA